MDKNEEIKEYNYYDNYNHIIDNIFVGNIFSFTDTDFIAGLDQIISLVQPPINITNSTQILFDDMDYVDIIPYAEQVYPLLDTTKKTLVHCSAGRSRSCGVVVYYIMKKYNKSFEDAYNIMKIKRNDTCINKGFIKRLQNSKECDK